MFRHRSDGKFAKDADPILGMTSHIMPHRYDAMVHFLHVQRCEPIDEYIREMSDKGIRYTYMDILIATLVRMYAERPKINRFVMNGSGKNWICFTDVHFDAIDRAKGFEYAKNQATDPEIVFLRKEHQSATER